MENVLLKRMSTVISSNSNKVTVSASFIRDQRIGSITEEGPRLPWTLL